VTTRKRQDKGAAADCGAGNFRALQGRLAPAKMVRMARQRETLRRRALEAPGRVDKVLAGGAAVSSK
jgi:hypothetical protein